MLELVRNSIILDRQLMNGQCLCCGRKLDLRMLQVFEPSFFHCEYAFRDLVHTPPLFLDMNGSLWKRRDLK